MGAWGITVIALGGASSVAFTGPLQRANVRARGCMHMGELGLTPELSQVVETFRMVPDQKLRYQQLLFLAQQSKPLADEYKTPENKVPGCLSTVHVRAFSDAEGKVFYEGDSDAQLTKGLVVLLVSGLSGHTPEEIAAVDPKFIHEAGIAASLTPGRNNGLLNMLGLMKKKAMELKAAAATPTPAEVAAEADGLGPVGQRMAGKLREALKPVRLELVDNSAQHAGHAGREGLSSDGETHFALEIVADAFEGLSPVACHRLVYDVLKEEMATPVHALQIVAKSPGQEGES